MILRIFLAWTFFKYSGPLCMYLKDKPLLRQPIQSSQHPLLLVHTYGGPLSSLWLFAFGASKRSQITISSDYFFFELADNQNLCQGFCQWSVLFEMTSLESFFSLIALHSALKLEKSAISKVQKSIICNF